MTHKHPVEAKAASSSPGLPEMKATFFDHAPGLFCVGDRQGVFRSLNPRWQQTLGYDVDRLTGTSFLELVHPEDRATSVAELERLCNGRETKGFCNRYRCRDGSYQWLKWYCPPLGEDGLLYALAEEVHQEPPRCGVVDGQHVARIAHDLRNVLTVVSGHAHLGLTNPDANRAHHLSAILLGVEHCSALTFELKSPPNARPTHAPIDVLQVLHEVMDIAVAQATDNVTLRSEVALELPPIQGSSVCMWRALFNLIKNSIEAMEGRTGEIVVRCGVTSHPGSESVVIEVEDSGQGMDEHTVRMMFEAGYSTRPRGSGLGMATVRAFVESHNGVVTVRSTREGGTTVRLSLPTSES